MTKIQARIILEILGRPKEYVLSSLSALLDRLSKEKGVLILDKTIHNPIEVKEAKNLFTSFAELTLELEDITTYFGIMFAYMPSNIETIYPEKIVLGNAEFNEVSHRLAQRLHDYEAITKRAIMEKNIAESKLKEFTPEIPEKPKKAKKKRK